MSESRLVKKWSNVEEEQLINEIQEGLEDEEIAKRHQRSMGAIKIRQKKIAVRLYEKGEDLESIKTKLKIEPDEVLEQKKVEENQKKGHQTSDKKLLLVRKKLQEIVDLI